MSEWVNVKEKLPSIGKALVFSGVAGVMVGYFAGHNTSHYVWKSYIGYVFWDDEVTHWMPLPEPPKEG